MMPSCWATSANASVISLATCVSSGGDGVALRRLAPTIRAIQRVTGPSARAIGANVGKRTSRTRSGSRETIASGNSNSHTITKPATDKTTSVSVCGRSTPMRFASSAVTTAGDEAEQQPRRNEQQRRIVEVGAERAGTIAALGEEPQRQPHQRAEGRFDGAEIYGGNREEENQKRNHGADRAGRVRCARSIRPSRRPPFSRNRRSTRRIVPLSLLVVVAEQMQKSVQRQNPQLGALQMTRRP